MQMIKVLIGRHNDPKKIVDDDFADHFQCELEIIHAAVLESGTASGATSITLGLKGPDGKTYSAQIIKKHFETVMKAIVGAEAYWKENPVKNIWKDPDPKDN